MTRIVGLYSMAEEEVHLALYPATVGRGQPGPPDADGDELF
jgi:hypothetical protein